MQVWSLGSRSSPGGGNGNPLQCSCLKNPMDRGSWWAPAMGSPQSWLSNRAHVRGDIRPPPGILVCSGCHNQTPPTGWLQQQKCICSQFWRLEVQDQGAVPFGVWWDLSFWLADLLILSSHSLSSVLVNRERSLMSYKDTSPSRLRPYLYDFMTLFFITSL